MGDEIPEGYWLYLPESGEWNLNSPCLLLESRELTDEEASDPEFDVPEEAKRHQMQEVLYSEDVKDIVLNALSFNPSFEINEIYDAFMFYIENDAFKF
ncbi:MAG: hypothetical protein KDB03_05130 [Planctomycetales bacterium]|nr:hypothetical protein [Planctomycetales bacterium]